MSERRRRIGRNEAAFREVNEHIEELGQRFELGPDTLELVCECGDGGCAERIPVSPEAYSAVRESPVRFFVVPGHEILDTEVVVERHDAYNVVEKNAGVAEEIARASDPAA